MDLCYDVTNQKVTRNAKKFIVNKSQNYLTLCFDFKTDDWTGAKYCIFHYKGEHYRFLLDNEGTVTVPRVVLQSGSFRFTLYCKRQENGEVVIVTSEEVTVHLRESGFVSEFDNDVTKDLDQDVVDELLEDIDGKSDKGHTHTKSEITDFPTLSTVATSGSYNDLSNKPSIPSKISDLDNDSDFIEKSETSGLVKNDGTIDTTSYSTFSGNYNDLSNKPSIPEYTSDLHNDGDGQDNKYVTDDYIVDNLTTDDSSKVLSAKQGKVLKDLIGDAITYING